MSYTFAVDSGKISDLAGELETARASVETGISDIFTSVEEMGGESGSWSGSSYDDFHTGVGNYRDALETLDEVIGAFKTELDNLVEPADTCVTSISNAIGTMKG